VIKQFIVTKCKKNCSPHFVEFSPFEPFDFDNVLEVQNHTVLPRPNGIQRAAVFEALEGYQTCRGAGRWILWLFDMPVDHEDAKFVVRIIFAPMDRKDLASSKPFVQLSKRKE